MSSLRIVSFEQVSVIEKEKKKANKSPLANIIVYSPEKKLKFLDSILKTVNESDLVHIVKCNNVTNLEYSLKSCKKGVETIVVSDELLDNKIINVIGENQKVMGNIDKFHYCFFLPSVEQFEPCFFHELTVSMISEIKEEVIEFISQACSKLSIYDSSSSISTVQSKDVKEMRAKLIDLTEVELKPIVEHTIENPVIEAIDNGVPHVGTYL